MTGNCLRTFWKSKAFWIRVLCVWLLAAGVGWLISNLGSSKIFFGGTDEQTYMNWYYNHKNRKGSQTDTRPCDARISVIDAGDSLARQRLPKLLKTLYSYEPKVIGLSAMYLLEEAADSATNDNLKSAIKACKDKLVVACAYYDDSFHSSFFVDPKDSLDEATANMPGLWNFQHEDSGGRTLSRFSPRLAERAGISVDSIVSKNFLVNYTDLELRSTDVKILYNKQSDSSWIEENVKGKIVLLGSTKDVKDYHVLPFKIKGQSHISGLMLHGYILNSLLQPETAFRKLTPIENLALNLLFLLLYCFIFVSLNSSEDCRLKEKNYCCRFWIVIMKPVSVFIFEIGTLLASWLLITDLKHAVPDIMLSAFAIPFIAFLDNIYTSLKFAKNEPKN